MHALNKDSVSIEECGNHGQFVDVSTLYLAIANMPYVHMSQDREFGLGVAGFKKLGVQFDGKVVQLFLRKDSVLDLNLRFFRGVGGVLGSIVAVPGLQSQLGSLRLTAVTQCPAPWPVP